MTYCSQTDLTDRYGTRELIQATDKAAPPTGTINTTVVARALADTDAFVDSYLGNRYVVPITGTVPARVVDLACVVARYKLHEDRATEKIRRDYEDAIRFLESVSSGKVTIQGLAEQSTDPEGEAGENFGVASVRAPAAVFTSNLLDTMP